ncbi:FAD/NAD(P)-binding domain-containing protein [Mycena amicta]|nr:FAD/NAD(P)-binding domain-containing protein [Mycena amicta]
MSASVAGISTQEALQIATEWLGRLDTAVSNVDVEAFAEQILATGWLRDFLCFSWDFRTISGRANIAAFLAESSRFAHAGLHALALQVTSSLGPPTPFPLPANSGVFGVSGVFTFSLTSPPAVGRAFFRLVCDPTDGAWRANTLFMNMEDLNGHEEQESPEAYTEDIWEELHAKRVAEIERDPTVLIVGAGQAGLMCAARLGRMGVRTLVIEKTARVGDVWRNRYPNLSLHTPAYHSYMLYHPWPTTFPKFLPKQKIGDFLEGYAISQELAVWVSTEIASQPVFDDAMGRWRVEVNRAGDKVSLSPRHVVLAVGTVGKPKIPQWPGMSHFRGTMYHSDEHKGAAPFAGKRVVVVGACNSGADMCQDFVLKGAAEVTMVQRSATCVLSARTADIALFRAQYPPQYSAADADFANNATPPALLLRMAVGITQRLKRIDRKLHDGLAKAGMKLTWEMTPGGGEVGLLGFLFDRVASGTLMDMGCGQLIIDGKVKIKQGVEITHIDPDGVVFADGSKIEADVVVLATGYSPIIDHYTAIFGRNSEHPSAEMQVWGMDHEGEIRRAYRPSGVPKLWFALGAFQQVRFMSKHLAIQILAEELGLKDV